MTGFISALNTLHGYLLKSDSKKLVSLSWQICCDVNHKKTKNKNKDLKQWRPSLNEWMNEQLNEQTYKQTNEWMSSTHALYNLG